MSIWSGMLMWYWACRLSWCVCVCVQVSFRLTSTPCVVVSGKYGTSANMERILKAQASLVGLERSGR